MWVSKREFDKLVKSEESKWGLFLTERERTTALGVDVEHLKNQKAKDDMTIDWMRHQVNALSKQNSILMAKVAGVHFPVPEIVPTRPGTLTMPDYSSMPSFEDVGDDEAVRLGLQHTVDGQLEFTK